MNKIIVIGCPGSGKSVFSRELHAVTGLPLFHLDLLYWTETGEAVSRECFLERLETVLARESWIIDGNYASTMEMRLQRCDSVVFLDYPVELCLEGLESRKGKARPDLPWVEPDTYDDDFVRFVTAFRTQSRPGILALLKRYPEKKTYIFRGRSEAEAFLKGLEKK